MEHLLQVQNTLLASAAGFTGSLGKLLSFSFRRTNNVKLKIVIPFSMKFIVPTRLYS